MKGLILIRLNFSYPIITWYKILLKFFISKNINYIVIRSWSPLNSFLNNGIVAKYMYILLRIAGRSERCFPIPYSPAIFIVLKYSLAEGFCFDKTITVYNYFLTPKIQIHQLSWLTTENDTAKWQNTYTYIWKNFAFIRKGYVSFRVYSQEFCVIFAKITRLFANVTRLF